MAERPQGFARRMMAQQLASDARADPFSDSRFFSGKIRPSLADMENPTRFEDIKMPAYQAGATGSLFLPGAGIADYFGKAPDPANPGQLLPGFSDNVQQGKYIDAVMQTGGAAGDVAMAAGALFPPAFPAAAALSTALKAPRAARLALSPEITRAISRNTDRNAKKVAKDLRQEGLLDVNDRDQSEAFYAEFERIRGLQGERKAAKPDRIDDLERNKNVRTSKATVLKAQKPIKESPMFDAWTKPNRERVLNSTYDSQTIDAEARLATVEAIAREAKKRGLEVYYTSKGQKGRAGSRYIELPDGGKVRISDHELPDTAQRQYTRSQGIGNFADEIIVDDWKTSSVDDYLNRILKRPNPNEASGAAMDAAQARYFETGKFEPPTADNPVSIMPPTETEPGIIAFHGSGADFDEFRLEMIGTGEGAQAYGYGLYFTDSEDIAKFYKETVQYNQRMRGSTLKINYQGKPFEDLGDTAAAEAAPPSYNAVMSISDEMFAYLPANPEMAKPEAAKERILSRIDANIERYSKAGQADADVESVQLDGGGTLEELILADLRQQKQALLDINSDDIQPATGKMYKVGIAPKPEELLDYDLSLRQQPQFAGVLKPIYDEFGVFETADIGTLLEVMKNTRRTDNFPSGITPKDFSQRLSEAGIPGIKYRAAGSRGAGTVDEAAERNYVIFDDKAVKILEKYGIVGPVAITAGVAGAARSGNDNEDGGSILPDAGIM